MDGPKHTILSASVLQAYFFRHNFPNTPTSPHHDHGSFRLTVMSISTANKFLRASATNMWRIYMYLYLSCCLSFLANCGSAILSAYLARVQRYSAMDQKPSQIRCSGDCFPGSFPSSPSRYIQVSLAVVFFASFRFDCGKYTTPKDTGTTLYRIIHYRLFIRVQPLTVDLHSTPFHSCYATSVSQLTACWSADRILRVCFRPCQLTARLKLLNTFSASHGTR